MSALLNIVLLGIGVVAFLGLGGAPKLRTFIDDLKNIGSAGLSGVESSILAFAEEGSQSGIEENLDAQSSSVATTQGVAGSQAGRGTVSVLIGEEVVQVPIDDVANISPAQTQFTEQKEAADILIQSGNLFLSQTELEDIQRLNVRAGDTELKLSGIQTVAAKQIEELNAFEQLIEDFGATFAGIGASGRPKLFGDPLFEFGGLTQAEFDAQKKELAAFDAEIREGSELTRLEGNIIGEIDRETRADIEAVIIESGVFDEELARQRLLEAGIKVTGSITEKSLATIIQSTGITI